VFFIVGVTNFLFFVGTSFRPLSLEVPQPLFPVAGYPVIYHHIEAASQVLLLHPSMLRLTLNQCLEWDKQVIDKHIHPRQWFNSLIPQ